ncbi:MAG: c-type cytochrome [Hyphomicrobiaceae bacterium]
MSSPRATSPPARLLALPLTLEWAGSQSVLRPESAEAEQTAQLFTIMVAGGAVILLLVVVLLTLAFIGTPAIRAALARERLVVVGGIAFPIVTLGVLLIYGFGLLAHSSSARSDPDALRLHVEGELWWWRVTYEGPDGEKIETANEIRIPVGRTVIATLSSDNVIHSFWVPRLAGKVDMIPGRTNTLRFSAARAGRYRGQCAEYCGGAHALMSFVVVALEPAEFAQWLEAESRPALQTAGDEARRGARLFIENGCGGCHRVRGTAARGAIGPDLTHVGSRLTLAAATLRNTPDRLAHWVVANQRIKPDNLMLPYADLTEDDAAAIASYLSGLR